MLQWFAGLFSNDGDDDTDDDMPATAAAERQALRNELDKARREAIPEIDFRQPPWLFEPLPSPSNVYLFIVAKDEWNIAAGKFAQTQNTVQVFDRIMVHRFARLTHFAKSHQQTPPSDGSSSSTASVQPLTTKPVIGYQRNDLLLVYAYFYDQERDEANTDNDNYLPDVRFEKSKGTRLMRPFEKGRDLYATFPLRLDAKTNKLVLPTDAEVTAEFEKCATQYSIKINKRHWRL